MWGLGLGMGLWLFLNDRFTWGEVGIEALHFRGVMELRKGNHTGYIASAASRTQNQTVEEGRGFNAKNSFNSSLSQCIICL
jgi:hypothetical protein